jgi:cysteinyl-tRNA synthetase
MSFFSRFRSFPEFHVLIDKLEDLHSKESDLVESSSQTFGTVFAYFAAHQPPATCEALKRLHPILKNRVAVSHDLHASVAPLAKQLQSLLPVQTDMSELCELMRTTEQAARRSQSAQDAGETDRAIANSVQRANLAAIEDMKKEIVDHICQSLKTTAVARREACGRLADIGRELIAASKFDVADEPNLAKLKETVKELEEEIIE